MKIDSKIITYKTWLLALSAYLILVIGLSYLQYSLEKKQLYKTIDQELNFAASSVALILPENFHHKGMKKSDLTPEQHLKNTHKLSRLTAATNIAYVYSLFLQEKDIVFTSSNATEDELRSGIGLSPFFSVYNDADPRVYEVFHSKEKIFIEYTDSWGQFRSVFLPQTAKDGTRYVLGADIAVSHIHSLFQKILYQTFFVSLLFLVFFYWLYRVLTKKLTLYADGLNEQVQKKTVELEKTVERLNLAQQAPKQGWFDLDLISMKIIVSDQYLQLLGYEADQYEPTLQEWQDNIHPEDKQKVLETLQRCISNNHIEEIEYRRRKKDGSWMWVHSIGQVIEHDHNNKPIRMVGVHADITERQYALQLIKEKEDKYRAMFETALIGMALNDKDGKLLDVNQAYLDIIGYSKEEAGQLTYWDLTPPSYEEQESIQLELLKTKGRYGPYEKEYIHKDGHLVPVILSGVSISVSNEEPHTWSCVQNITEQKQAEEKLELAASVFVNAKESITITDSDGIILDVNETFESTTGYSREEVIGKNPRILQSGRQSPQFYQDMWQALLKEGYWFGEVWNRRKSGEFYAEMKTVNAVRNKEGNISHYVALCSDITQMKSHQEQLEHIAHYDVLTNLPNRSLLADRLSQAMIRCKRYKQQSLAVIFLDLDGFKQINDIHGHAIGDELLIILSARMKDALREGDTLARIGGDEFVAILTDLPNIENCDSKFERLLLAASEPVEVHNLILNTTASIGVTFYPQDNVDADHLIRHADQAMYSAKSSGKNCYRVFDTVQEYAVKIQQKRLGEISRALENDEFVLYYQPKVNMKTGKVIGFEALIRWQHPEKGLLHPHEFLPIVESHTNIVEIGEWVIAKALGQISEWEKTDESFPLLVSVNIAAQQLQQANFSERLATILARYHDVKPHNLELEILETSALEDINAISEVMHNCLKLGIRFSIDDFGTGYSSLTYLRRLPASVIKIDQSFIRDMLIDPDDMAIVEGVISLAKSFKRDVIAEGVETVEHGVALLNLGCVLAQGYGIAKPMPADIVPIWLDTWKPYDGWME